MEENFPKIDGFKKCTVERLTFPTKAHTEEVIQQASLGALLLHNPLFRKLFLGINRLGLLLILKMMSSISGLN
jgi:hypothetical protein